MVASCIAYPRMVGSVLRLTLRGRDDDDLVILGMVSDRLLQGDAEFIENDGIVK